ncbi:hypothetical protein LCGC14_1626470, partial [marine sediment metagenome]
EDNKKLVFKNPFYILKALNEYIKAKGLVIKYSDLMEKSGIVKKSSFDKSLRDLVTHGLVYKWDKKRDEKEGYSITAEGLKLLNSINSEEKIEIGEARFFHEDLFVDNPEKFPVKRFLFFVILGISLSLLMGIYLVFNWENFPEIFKGSVEGSIGFLLFVWVIGIIAIITLMYKEYKDFKYSYDLPEEFFTKVNFTKFFGSSIDLLSLWLDYEQNLAGIFLDKSATRNFHTLFNLNWIVRSLIWIFISIYAIFILEFLILLIFILICLEFGLIAFITQNFENAHIEYEVMKKKIKDFIDRMKLLTNTGISNRILSNKTEKIKDLDEIAHRYNVYKNSINYKCLNFWKYEFLMIGFTLFILITIHIPQIIHVRVIDLEGLFFLFIVCIVLLFSTEQISKHLDVLKVFPRRQFRFKLNKGIIQLNRIQERLIKQYFENNA